MDAETNLNEKDSDSGTIGRCAATIRTEGVKAGY